MAKKNSAKPKTEAPAAPPTTSEMPVFSVDALSKLTERIQSGFDDAKRSKKGDNGNFGKHGGAVNERKRNRKGNRTTEPTNGNPKKTCEKKPHEQPKKLEQQRVKPAEIPSVARRKKRAHGGDIPKPVHYENPSPKLPQPVDKTRDGLPRKPGEKGGIDKERLLKEIIELGGTQEDLDLVDGIDSDEDEEEIVFAESGKTGKGLRKELQGFLKEIGLEAGGSPPVGDGYEDEDEGWADEDSGVEGEDTETEDEDERGGMDGAEEEPKTPAPAVKPLETKPDPKSKGSKLKVAPRPDWHAYKLPPLASPTVAPSVATIKSLHEHAKSLIQAENAAYSATHLTKSSDRQFLSTIMTSGTLSDKISALTLICQESPLHTMKSLETLLGLARKKSRSQAVSSMAAIKDLFGPGSVLPEDRKLRFFSKQPELGARETTEEHLIIWAYEDWLKNFYFEVLTILEGLCTDPLVFPRMSATGFIHSLLSSKPEQEANLLRLLVNKLGDTDKKVASKVSYLLLQLQTTHPAMKTTVISAIESEVLFRPGNGLNAKYYAIITLNQTILSAKDNYEAANKLLGEKNKQFRSDLIAKLLSAILTGVNRAFPFSQVDDDVFEKHIDTLFRITHSGNFNTSIQAMMLIFQVSNSKQAVSDRFYRTLYESLLDQRLVNSSKQAMYLNLLFRALKADTQVKRVKAFVKRLVQIAATFHQPPFICGVLYLLNELCDSVPSGRSLLEEPEQLEDDEEEVFKDVPEDGEGGAEDTTREPSVKYVEYDGRRRNPLFTNADRTCLWELIPLLRCYHPSVALFATSFLENKPMPSKPDLGMHTLTHFLDRFVYRNAKATPIQSRGSSIMQPLGGSDTRGVILSTRGVSKAQIPVNSEAFWKRKVEEVDADEVFFHKYFNQIAPKKAAAEKKKAKKAGRDEEGEDNEEDSEAESEIWKAMVDSRPDIEEGDVDFDDEDNTAEFSDISDDSGEEILDLAEDEDDVWGSEDGGDGKEAPRSFQKAFEIELETATRKDEGEGAVAEGEIKNKRRKLKHLPTFASAEDYAHMLED
ncbi:CBF-domain-containing protein [Tuber magnatum]|uniref:CCAAT/enhancer-binding protein zeta n=1 Tax=Tuber magnatum TaxID=42249 RepID=A0A317SDE3_9PEZI|nr:CBF-domain-containing protein [Tuber magnatum]